MTTYLHRKWYWLGCGCFILLLSLTTAFGWPYSGESNIFDLTPGTPEPINTYFTAESNIFPLEGMEETYTITLSATYSAGASTVRVIAYAYDVQNGVYVSTGTGNYKITQGGATIGGGSLTYSSASRVWDSGAVAFSGSGTYSVVVTINGHAQATTFTVGAGAPVPLAGTATDDNGNPLSGATVKLYNASTVLGASDLNNLPVPLATTNTPASGTFGFGNRPVGQYILVIVTANGTTIGPAFWLRNGETTHNETLIENPGRTVLLGRMLSLRNSIQTQVVDKQTEWMQGVANTLDGDLDATPDLLDWAILVANIASGTAQAFEQAGVNQLTVSEFGRLAAGVTGKNLVTKGLVIGGTVAAEEFASIDSQAEGIKGALAQPYFAYGASATLELQGIDTALGNDVEKLLDPGQHTPFLQLAFSRNDPIHRHPESWFESLESYQFSQQWLQNYYSAGVTGLPTLASRLNVKRAQSLFDIAVEQLTEVSVGSGQLFVGPNPAEWTSATATFEPLALNLYDYKAKYETGKAKKEVLDWTKKGSGIVSVAGHGVAAASLAGVVSAPGAAVGETVAWVASGVNLGASVLQATVKADMVATYAQMSSKYSANLLTAPLALKRVDDFLISEAANPYYLNSSNQFAGNFGTISLGGTTILGREVFFPVQLTMLPFAPPIQLTGVKNATVPFGAPAGGYSSAVYRVESKITDFSGVHDHVVIRAGQFAAGQNGQVQQPFMGHMQANGIFTAGKFESRLWVGPFQKAIKTKDFLVMPINIGFPSAPLSAQTVQSEMRKPLSFVKMEQQSLSGEDIVALADRVRERVETNLVVGGNVVEKAYTFSNDVFEAEFRLYRPPGAKVRFTILENGEYIGWDSTLSTTHLGFPGAYSGPDANPELISVPNCAGRTLTVRVELDDVTTEPINVLVEVWEKPVRNAVLVVLPDSVNIAVQPGQTNSIELGVGESSQQQPLQNVAVSLSGLNSTSGQSLQWSAPGWTSSTNLTAGSVRICDVQLDASTAAEGTYTGVVSVTASNAGTVQVPVSVTVDGTAPMINLVPVREWWHMATGPVLGWAGQDNITAASNLLYSVYLQGVDTGWSGFSTNTTRDLSGLSDGHYTLYVVGKDQALNQTATAAALSFYIDRAGNLFKQRIVDFDPNDAITNISQVNWDDDFDHDGGSNYQEYIAGTDPTDPTDNFAITSFAATSEGFRLRWKGKRGGSYLVLKSFDLKAGSWVEAPSGAAANQKSRQQSVADGIMEYIDTIKTNKVAFYKVQAMEGGFGQPFSNSYGVPDWWLSQYGLPVDDSGAGVDSDGDGLLNWQEYVAGTDPTNRSSVFALNISSVSNAAKQIKLLFNPVVAGRGYTSQFCTDLVGGVWTPLTAYAGPVTNGNQITITDTNAVEPRKFYRIQISLP